MVYTEEEYTALVARMGRLQLAAVEAVTPALPSVLVEERRQSPTWPYRSRTEQRYAQLLEQWLTAGQLVRWRYEAMRLTLAPRTTLTVDFWLTMPPGLADPRPQLHECKGGFDARQEESLAKLKQAAVLYPDFRFFKVHYRNHAWVWREIPAG